MTQIPKISDAEWQVMKIIWARGRATTNEVVEALAELTSWKPKTVMTLLKRLVDKGALDYEKKGRVYDYFSLVGEAECVLEESRTFLNRVFGGALTPMLSHFLENQKLSKKEIEELKHLLENRGKK